MVSCKINVRTGTKTTLRAHTCKRPPLKHVIILPNVLTPDYNKAYHDHFHLDHGPRYSSCDPEWYTFLRMQYRRLKTFF